MRELTVYMDIASISTDILHVDFQRGNQTAQGIGTRRIKVARAPGGGAEGTPQLTGAKKDKDACGWQRV